MHGTYVKKFINYISLSAFVGCSYTDTKVREVFAAPIYTVPLFEVISTSVTLHKTPGTKIREDSIKMNLAAKDKRV